VANLQIIPSRNNTVKVYGSRGDIRVYLPDSIPANKRNEIVKDLDNAIANDWTPSKIEFEINYFLKHKTG
jgi:hypothetical protein